MIKKLIKYAVDPGYRFRRNAARGHYDEMPDEEFLKRMYKAKTGRTLHLDDPKTFNEKLQWLKIHDHNPAYTKMVDKLEVKKYIEDRIGSQYVIPTIGVWDSFEQIDFDALPQRFVLKCTHDSGHVVLCPNKQTFNYKQAKKILTYSLAHNYYYRYREWPYKDVVPKIIAEPFMAENDNVDHTVGMLNDYKLQCFDGKFDNVFVAEGRFSERGVRFHYFDRNWNYIPYCPYQDIDINELNKLRPECFEEMISIAEKLSHGLPELRVDLYEIKGKVFFGELTFYSQSGFDTDITAEADQILGEKLTLPVNNK